MKVSPYHLSGGNGKTHENLVRPNDTSSKYRQSPTFILNSWKRILKSSNRHINYTGHSVPISQTYINIPDYGQPTKQLCQPLWYIQAWIQPKVTVKRSRHHTSEYPPHFWWLHKGCLMKLILPTPLVNYAKLFKTFLYVTSRHNVHINQHEGYISPPL
jgi:hypothetical protein